MDTKDQMSRPVTKNLAPIISLLFYCRFQLNRHKTLWKVYIFIVTFLTYCSYHLARRPAAVVKTVWHMNCSAAQEANRTTDVNPCGWKPFDEPITTSNVYLGGTDSAFLFCYAFSMYINGICADRSDLRWYLSIGCCLSGLFTCLLGVAYFGNIHSLAYFVIMQMLAGTAASTGWPSVVAIMGNWFGTHRRGFIFGIWNTHLYIGNIVGALIAGVFVESNWGLSFLVPGLIQIAVASLIFLTLVPHPQYLGMTLKTPRVRCRSILGQSAHLRPSQQGLAIRHQDNEPPTSRITYEVAPDPDKKAIGFFAALCLPSVIDFSVTLFFTKFTAYTFMYWLPRYQEHEFKMGGRKSAFMSTAFDVGGILGGLIAGLLLDYAGSSATTCACFLALACPSVYFVKAYASRSEAANIMLLILCGALVDGPYGLITTAVSTELGAHEALSSNLKAMSTVVAIIDGTGSVGAAVGPLVAGVVSAKSSWDHTFYVMMAADVIAFLCILPLSIKEIRKISKCKCLSSKPKDNPISPITTDDDGDDHDSDDHDE